MVQVLISTRFLEHFNKFLSYNIEDFKNSTEINLESFQFIERLLYSNKSEWILNICETKIFDYKSLCSEDFQEDEREIANIIKMDRRNIIKGNPHLYDKIINGKYNEIGNESVPPYLFLADHSKEICQKIESDLGLIVLSTKYVTLSEDRIKAIPKTLANTSNAIIDQFKSIPFNSVEMIDPYFAERYLSNDGKGFLEKLSYNTALRQIKIITSYGKTASQQVLDTIKQQLKEKFGLCIHSITIGAKHDRFIYTNTATITIGNSLLTQTRSLYTQFPIGIYGREFFQ